MIVPAMTKPEIVKELRNDFAIVRRKAKYVSFALQRQLKKTKNYPFLKIFDYTTPKSKNKWIFFLQFRNKKSVLQMFLNHHYNSKGLMVCVMTSEGNLNFYSGHVFARFAQRDEMEIINPVDKIKKFFTLNNQIVFQSIKDLDGGASEVIAKVNTGVLLGIENRYGILICNTYLSHELLFKDQTLIINALKPQLDELMQEYGKLG
jgi:hypothetical protein